MNKILFLTHYTARSANAFQDTLALAHRAKATFTVAHVYAPLEADILENFALVNFDPSPDFQTQLIDQWEREQDRLARFVRDHMLYHFQEVPILLEACPGDLLSEIARLQKKYAFDCIVDDVNCTANNRAESTRILV